MEREALRAIDILKKGGVIVFPTDTAFGIGCRVDNEKAVERIFAIKGRDERKATPVLVSSIDMAQQYVDDIPSGAYQLMEKYWPGALTIVLPSTQAQVPTLVTGGSNSLGVRMPDYFLLLQIIEAVGVPLIGTSANLSGENTPFTVEGLNPSLVRQVDMVLSGSCKIKQPSTVVDYTQTPYRILREGAIRLEKEIQDL